MTNVDKDFQRSAGVISTIFAVLFLCMLAAFVQPKLPIWHKLPAAEKFWTIFASAYAGTLALSGLMYAICTWRVVGLFHGALMLCLAGLALYGIVFTRAAPQVGDPAAGVAASANIVLTVVCSVVGAVAGLCGIGVLYSIFPQARKEDTGR
jgi:hypothetical protein